MIRKTYSYVIISSFSKKEHSDLIIKSNMLNTNIKIRVCISSDYSSLTNEI